MLAAYRPMSSAVTVDGDRAGGGGSPERRRRALRRRAAAGRSRGTAGRASRSPARSPAPALRAARGPLGRALGQRLRETQVHRQRDEVLLGAVVDVALERTAPLVLDVDEPLSRGTELLGPPRSSAARLLRARRAAVRCAAPGRPGRRARRRAVPRPRSAARAPWHQRTPSSSPPCRTGSARRPGSPLEPCASSVAAGGHVAARVGRPAPSATPAATRRRCPRPARRAIRAGSSSAG